MKQTTNHKLNKPDYTDVADIADINANMDIIDANLGKVTTPDYTDNKNNKYTDINGMHLRTDNAIYTKGGIKIVSVDPCTDGENLTEEDVTREKVNLYVFAKIDEYGNAVFKELEASNLDVSNINADMIAVDGATLQELALHFKRAKGALYTDNSAEIASDGSRKFILGVYKDIPSVDANMMPTTLPNAGVVNINNRTHIVVATYDTKNPLKANADYTCTSTNASSVLKTAINAVAQGCKVELLDGTYILQYDEDAIELTKDITIEGCGYKTTIHQPADENAGEAKPIFIINGQNVRLKGMMLCDNNVSSPVPIIKQQTQGAIYDDVFFIFNAEESSGGGACIKGYNDCNYTRIQNCRVYKGFNDSNRVMFDFGDCTKFGGVVGANISSGYNNISINFANEGDKNNTAIYGHSNIDIKVNA